MLKRMGPSVGCHGITLCVAAQAGRGAGGLCPVGREERWPREDSDMTQAQAAAILGIRQAVYSRYERGFQTILLELLLKLADLHGVSLGFLTGRTKNKNANK